jgi:hypothetical protein
MLVCQKKIAPPLAPLSEDEQMKLIAVAVASEDQGIKDLIARLAVFIRDIHGFELAPVRHINRVEEYV